MEMLLFPCHAGMRAAILDAVQRQEISAGVGCAKPLHAVWRACASGCCVPCNNFAAAALACMPRVRSNRAAIDNVIRHSSSSAASRRCAEDLADIGDRIWNSVGLSVSYWQLRAMWRRAISQRSLTEGL